MSVGLNLPVGYRQDLMALLSLTPSQIYYQATTKSNAFGFSILHLEATVDHLTHLQIERAGIILDIYQDGRHFVALPVLRKVDQQ